MQSPTLIDPVSLTNTVTAYATILSGVLCIVLTLLTRPQPYRWLLFYLCIILTGIPTVWYHGFGETFAASVGETATQYLLLWTFQLAVLGDYYGRRNRYLISGASAAVNLLALAYKIIAGPASSRIFVLHLGGNNGYHITDAVIILDALLVAALFLMKLPKTYAHSKPLLYLNIAIFLTGFFLAIPANSLVDYRILAYRAIWHMVGAFGFVTLWIFNFIRFSAIKIR